MSNAFRPTGNGVLLAATASAQILTFATNFTSHGYAIRFALDAGTGVYIKFGTLAQVTATPASPTNFDLFLPSGIVEVAACRPQDEAMSYVTASGTHNLWVNRGEGI